MVAQCNNPGEKPVRSRGRKQRIGPRGELVLRHLPFVRRIARRLAAGARGVELDDVVAAGTVGLLEAVHRYDPRRGVALTSFAYPRIKGAVLDEIDRQRQVWRADEAGQELSLDEPIWVDGVQVRLIDVTANPTSPAPSTRAELSELLYAVASLPWREREMVRLQVKGYSVAEIAYFYRCSQSRASQLLERARLRLREVTAA
jgi:RNA polymerase sigma factor (sigma-70 family)